jgi:putative hydrolase of the HAD superfamily
VKLLYKNIIFDLGGVVVDYAPREFLVDHFLNERLENALYDITFGSEEWLQMDAGLLSREDANRIMREKGAAINRSYEVDIILNDWFDMLKTKDDTVLLIKRLKKRGYRLFYLSNISWDVLELLAPRKFWSLFDGGITSCEVHLLKPDLRIYQALINKYQLNAKECIFVDDNTTNASAAFDVDMTGIHFRNVRTLQRALLSYGVESEKKLRVAKSVKGTKSAEQAPPAQAAAAPVRPSYAAPAAPVTPASPTVAAPVTPPPPPINWGAVNTPVQRPAAPAVPTAPAYPAAYPSAEPTQPDAIAAQAPIDTQR